MNKDKNYKKVKNVAGVLSPKYIKKELYTKG